MDWGQKAPKKLQLIRENFFGRATILMEVKYLNFKPISWHLSFLVQIHFDKVYLCTSNKKGSQNNSPHKGKLYWRATILIKVIYLNF